MYELKSKIYLINLILVPTENLYLSFYLSFIILFIISEIFYSHANVYVHMHNKYTPAYTFISFFT